MSGPLDALLRPRSVAVIGASSNRHSLGGMVTHRLFAAGYAGAIYPVNPRQQAVHSTKAYPSLLAIPDPIDLAIVVVPRDAVLAAADECCAKGVGAIAVITSGFKEAGTEGAALERQLAQRLREAGVRFIGPNCMGLFNTHPDLRLDATFSPTPPLAGPVGFASQSGALGVVVLNVSRDRGLGFSHFVSLGNKSDIAENDMLAAWENDPDVPVVTLYLESFTDAGGFLERARAVTRKKPVVLLKAGRTAAGARAASSHTGALAAADTGTDALCRQAGVIRVATVDEMLDTALVLSRCRPPRGPRVAVLTNAGGPGIMASDRLAELGFELVALQPKTREALDARLPPQASSANPVDVLPSASPDDYAFCLERLLEDDGVDAVVTIAVTPPLFDPLDVLRALTPVARASDKPVLTVFMVEGEFFARIHAVSDPPPIFRTPEPAAEALAHALADARARTAPERPLAEPVLDDARIAELIAAGTPPGGGYLEADATFQILEAAGLPVAPWRLVAGDTDAVAAGAAIGFPVVLKAAGATLIHKSDIGGVALGIASEAALAAEVAAMRARLVAAGAAPGSWRWFVQAMRPGGREIIVGASRDPSFGPLVMAGLGGKYVEVLKDVRFAMAALREGEALGMLTELRGARLLTGTRGESGVALDAGADAIERIAALVRRHPEIAELDMNPLLLFPERERTVVVDARIRVDAGGR